MHILIVRNNSNSQAVDASLLLATYLATQGLDYTLVDSSDLSCRCDHEELNGALASGVEMAVVLGGDGTILRTARQIGTSGVPVLGINFGRLGFLANTGDEGVIAVVASALAGDVVEMDLSLNRDPREAALFADGELLSFDAPVKRVYVSRGAVPTTLLRYRHDGFYEHAAKVFF